MTTRFTPGFRTGVVARYHIDDCVYIVETSTRPGYHVATYVGGWVNPRSLKTFATVDAALNEVERRAADALRRKHQEGGTRW